MRLLKPCCLTGCCCLRVFLLLTWPPHSLASTEEYTMDGDNCNRYIRGKEAVMLKGSGGKRYMRAESCDVTVSSANNARWMIHMQTSFILDCGVKVTVYDTNVASIPVQPVLEVMCASRDPGVIRLNASVVLVRLHHRNASDYNFNLVLTSRIPHPDQACPWFQCDSGDCVPKSLMCDGINNCFDNSDEAKNGTAHCDDYWPFKGENWGVLASVLGAAVVLGVTAACCRRLRKRRDSLEELYDLNEGPYVHKYAYQYRVIRHPHNITHQPHGQKRNDRLYHHETDKGVKGKLVT